MWKLEGGGTGLGQADMLAEEERKKKFAKALSDAGDKAKKDYNDAAFAPADEPELLKSVKDRIAQGLREKRRIGIYKPAL